MKYNVGDRVSWTSQAAGRVKIKIGVVDAVVPPFEMAQDFGDAPKGCGMSRDHESYLVRVGKQRRCYWPRVHLLSMVAGVTDDALRALWKEQGGSFYGPIVETGHMPEAKLLPFLRTLVIKAGGI